MPAKRKVIVNGQTRLVAIFGWPLNYTLSPLFQNAALVERGIDACYLPLATDSSARFKALTNGLMASPHFVGANVTNPFKAEALRLAQSASPAARAIGAANVLVRQGNRWVAHNTDGPGFLAAAKSAGARVKGARILILGAGGAARAIAWAVASEGATEVVILARRLPQAQNCAKVAKNKGFGAILSPKNLSLASQAATWVVNTLPGSPLGRTVALDLSPAVAGQWAMDLNYLPRPISPFLAEAQRRGYRILDGLPMLLEQGRLSFKLWFGQAPAMMALLKTVKKEVG